MSPGPTSTVLILGLLLTTAVGVSGQPGPREATAGAAQYRIDAGRSEVTFKARSRLVDAVGRFHRFGGEMSVDPRDLRTATLTLSVDAASIDTNNRKRDDHLRSADFFDVTRHPLVRFESVRIVPATRGAAVHGRLTIRGITREVAVPVEVEIGDGNIVARGAFALDRQDYGIAYQSALNPVQDVIDVAFTIHARRRSP